MRAKTCALSPILGNIIVAIAMHQIALCPVLMYSDKLGITGLHETWHGGLYRWPLSGM